ncbi:hypothetical protein Q5425_35560 [Amycolatopsis sp. A133]|uniref:hypothetical protein n=1 Tax=Amycolatopsis sp. A133 TaxID=3064472 RepID=UPI0027F26DAB|nr:hypothetical protein [Amycolatopsis sp. A133]MDQ7809073.1 hypothetical protein [Amycolatopsis sp. A133]
MIGGSAVSYAASPAIVLFLPAVPPKPAGTGPRWVALRDRPYLALTLLDGVLAIQYRVLTAAVPLWLVARTTAPNWTISGVMVVNTVIVVFFQVRASRRIDTTRAGAVAFRRAGFAFLAACVAIAARAGAPTWLALVFLLSFALAPPHAVGQYQGLFGMGLGLGVTLGPAVLIALCITWGTPGWFVIGGILAATGLAVPAVVRWAERDRSRQAAVEPQVA